MKRWSLVGTLLLAAGALPAQQAPPLTAIRAGTLIDGTGAAPVRNAVILIQGGRITAVGADVRVPAGATLIDLSAYTVLPGFIDAHAPRLPHHRGR
jgi:imidazolonepropionase-like amidohydrolase